MIRKGYPGSSATPFDFCFVVQAVKLLLGRVASPDITMHEIEGGAHELYIGLERDQVRLNEIHLWVKHPWSIVFLPNVCKLFNAWEGLRLSLVDNMRHNNNSAEVVL